MGSKPINQRNFKKDRNHNEVVKTLRLAGYAVHETHMVGNGFPDLVVGIPGPYGSPGINLLLEVKNKVKWIFTKKQLRFLSQWPGLVAVVSSPEEALELCNAIKFFWWEQVAAGERQWSLHEILISLR